MTTLAAIQLGCPVCQTRFESHRIASTNSVGQDTDFRPHTGGLDPQPHYVHVCPQCLFAAFEGDFQEVQETVRAAVLESAQDLGQIAGDEDVRSLRGSTKYLLSARCYASDSRASDFRLADLYLRASWCARQEGLTAREREAQCESILLFEKALDVGEVAEDQQATIYYLLGELYRRIGRFEFAAAMFGEAMRVQEEGEPEPRFTRLVERQRAAARDHISDNMQIEAE